jgi:adenine-specific DNA methylase
MKVRSKKEIKHIDYAIVAKAHTPMYLMHKWWARKPHNVVSEYIKHYTKEGEIVLDPFCGSGVTPIEAIKAGRKGIGIDLDPMATFITKMTAIPFEIDKIESAFKKIRDTCEKEIEKLYITKCKKCGKNAIILATIWDREKGEPLEIRYYCENCTKRNAKKPENDDLKLLKKIEKIDIRFWYPETRLAYNGGGFKEGTHISDVDSVDKLFTRRNLISLSIVYNAIEKIKELKIREIFQFSFTSMSHLASRMCPVAEPGGRGHWSKFSATSFWSQHRYYLPLISMESNVWMLFESAIKASNNQIKSFKEAKKFSDLNENINIIIKTHNALELSDIIPENSIDYVFTDPPYGGAVQYFELSTLWASWLKMDLNYKDEITINTQQEKDFEYYHKMLRAAFKQIYSVLKPGKYLTVTFHSTEIQVWNSIIKAVVMVGFDLEKIVYQPPARTSAKGLLQPYGSAVGDYYIRFKKPEKDVFMTEKEIDLNTYEMDVVDSAQRIIGYRGEPTIYQHILNGIMVDLEGGRNIPIGAKNVEDVLKEHIGIEFELIPIYDEKNKKIGKKWWLKGADIK